jgi:GGDEF domain-containing protein
MTSLLKHVSDLDRFESNQKASLAGYVAAVECMAQYAVDVDPSLTEKHRGYLRIIRQQVMDARQPEALMETQSALRAELRDFRDKCEIHLSGLKQEFTAALLSLSDVMGSLASSGQGQEKHLKQELTALETLAEASDPEELRRGVHSAVRTIADCVQQMKRENDVIVAQFKDEIRMMHGRIQMAEASATLDTATGALKRSEFENRVRRDVLRDVQVCLGIARIGNYRDLRSRHGTHLIGEALVALARRIREGLGENVDLGRWSEDTFMVKLLCAKQDALKLSKELGHRVAGAYVCMEEGRRYTLNLTINIGTIDFHASDDGDQFLAKAELLCGSLG